MGSDTCSCSRPSLGSLPQKGQVTWIMCQAADQRRHKGPGHPASHATTWLGHASSKGRSPSHAAPGLGHASNDHNNNLATHVCVGLLLATIKGGALSLLCAGQKNVEHDTSTLTPHTTPRYWHLPQSYSRDLGLTRSLNEACIPTTST
jgi:hypothetical protein